MKNKLIQIGYLAIAALSSSLLTLAVGYFYVTFYVLQPFQKEAVDNGFAQWVVTDTANGATKFAWNQNAEVIYNVLNENEKPLTAQSK